MMTLPLLILTMKWGTLYSSADVNRLAAQVRRHLDRPHRFICFTDDAAGLDPRIEAMALPELGLPAGSADTRWRKLALFRHDLRGADGLPLVGTALFLDLDLVVVGDLGPFWDHPGAVAIIRDDDLFRPKPLRRLRPGRDAFLHMVGNTSVFRFVIGAHPEILRCYLDNPAKAAAAYEHEQQLVSDLLNDEGKLSYWPREWCVSFKNHCVGRGVTSWLRDPVCPPGARIVVFAGAPKMGDVLAGRGGRWYRRIGRIDWLKKAWAGS